MLSKLLQYIFLDNLLESGIIIIKCGGTFPYGIAFITLIMLIKFVITKIYSIGEKKNTRFLPYREVMYYNPYFLNYYLILGVSQDASNEEIEYAYLKIMKRLVRKGCRDFEIEKYCLIVKQAYITLMDREEREFYNEVLIIHYYYREN